MTIDENLLTTVMKSLRPWTTEDNFARKSELIADVIDDFPSINHEKTVKLYVDWLIEHPVSGKTKGGKKKERNVATGYRNWCENTVYGFGKKPKVISAPKEEKREKSLTTVRNTPIWDKISPFLKENAIDELWDYLVAPLRVIEDGETVKLISKHPSQRDDLQRYFGFDISRAVRYAEVNAKISYLAEGED